MVSTHKNTSLVKLDMYDKKIFAHLLYNSRISRKKLAHKLHISPQRLHYKITRLEQEVMHPAIILNYGLLDINSYIIFITDVREEEIRNIIELDSIFFALQLMGKYQYVLKVVADDIEAFCRKHLPNSFVEIHPVTKYIYDDWKGFGKITDTHHLKKDTPIKLDVKDYKILLQLCVDPVASFLSLSKETGVHRETITKRMHRMEAANVIQKYRYAVNFFKTGFLTYLLKIESVPAKKERLINCYRADYYCGYLYGTYTGFITYYFPPTYTELYNLLKELKKIDPGVQIEVIQNNGFYKVEPIPKRVIDIFKERSSPK